MKKVLFVFTVILVSLIGCNKDIVNDENVLLKKRSGETITVPARCVFTTIPDFSLGYTLCSPPEMEVGILSGGFMEGNISHGGKLISALSNYRVIDCDFNYTELRASENIEGIHTAANGDQYSYIGTIQLDITNGILSGEVIVTGGTGRYEGSTAFLTIAGIHDLSTNIASMTGEGYWTFRK